MDAFSAPSKAFRLRSLNFEFVVYFSPSVLWSHVLLKSEEKATLRENRASSHLAINHI